MGNRLRGLHHSKKIYESTIPLNTSVEANNSPKSRVFLLIILLVLVLSGALYLYLKTSYPFLFKTITTQLTSITATPEPSAEGNAAPILTPTPIPYSLPKGTQKYSFNHGSDVRGPKPSSLVIDPLDPQQGSTQTITIDIASDSPVTSTQITIYTDNSQKSLSLTRISGDELKGTYQTSWEINDTYETKYAIQYVFKSSTGTFDNVMRLRQ